MIERVTIKFASDKWLVGFLPNCMIVNKGVYTAYLYQNQEPGFEPSYRLTMGKRQPEIDGIDIDTWIALKDLDFSALYSYDCLEEVRG